MQSNGELSGYDVNNVAGCVYNLAVGSEPAKASRRKTLRSFGRLAYLAK